MATNPNATQITPPRVALIDVRTGAVSREWYRWFYSLYNVVGGGVGVIPVASGGTGLSTIPTNGQLLIGNGTGYTLNTLAVGDGISVVNGLGTITLANTGVLSFSGGVTGLTPTTATNGDVVLAGTLIAANGGTGFASYAVGDLLYADTTTTLAKLPDVATGNALISGGVGVAPAWGKIGLATHVSGTLPIANGGTNGTTTPTAGAVAYGTGTAYGFTATGTAGQVLTSAGAGIPTWTTPTTGTVTSVGATAPITSTGGTTPTIGVTSAALTKTDDTNVTLTLGGSPTTSLLAATSLTLGWTGQLATSRGGTGLSSYTTNGILYASSTSTIATNANLTYNGTTLEIGGTVSAGGQLSAYDATSGAIGVFSDTLTTITAGLAVSSTVGPDISFSKNRGTYASLLGVNNGDTVGRLRFIARDVTGGTGREVARIDSLVDSVPASNDISGTLVFNTRQSGSGGALTIAGRINRFQNWAIGNSNSANVVLRVVKTITGGTNSYGIYTDSVIQPDATSIGQYYSSVHATAANGGTPYTVANIVGYSAAQATLNADSTVTSQYGFFVNSSLIGATNNYGFYSNIASGTGRWNFVAGGTADNAFNGNSRFGSATAPTAKVHMAAGTATASTAPLKFTSGTNLTAVEAGAVEYDGTIVSATPYANYGRAAIPLTNYASGTGTALGTNTEATNAVLLPAANDTITLAAGTYFLDTSFIVTRGATSTTSATARMNIRGTGTAVGNFSGMSLSAPTAGGATANFSFDAVNITTDNVLTAASTTAAGVYTITLRGILKVTTGGTIIPQYSLSANINAAGTVSKVLYLRLQQMDTQSAAAAGPAGTGWA